MAQEFLNYTDQTENYQDYILGAATFSSAYPMTLNVWFYPSAVSGSSIDMVSVGNTLTDSSGHRLRYNRSTLRVLGLTFSTTNLGSSSTSTGIYTSNAWNMATYVCTSTISRTVYVNAGSPGTSVTSRVVTAPTDWVIGGYYSTQTLFPSYEGDLAEFSVWNAALTVAEITSLYRGTKADMIRPQNLSVYVPLVRNHTDTRGLTTSITSNFPSGATVKDHIRRYG
jgi:hypothetical protein